MHLQSSGDAPSSVTVITAAEIQEHGYRTLADILRTVRSFYVTYDRNYSSIGVRGFARPGDYNTRVLLMVDGHRMNDNVYDEAMIGTEFPVDVDMIQRIEIIRGPASSLYGSNALFAVINVITRHGQDVNSVELSSDAGSFNSYKGRAPTAARSASFSFCFPAPSTAAGGITASFFRSSTPARPTMASPATSTTTSLPLRCYRLLPRLHPAGLLRHAREGYPNRLLWHGLQQHRKPHHRLAPIHRRAVRSQLLRKLGVPCAPLL